MTSAASPLRSAIRPLLLGASILVAALILGDSTNGRRFVRFAVAAAAGRAPRFADRIDAAEFRRGNLHTHSSRSDGDVAPEEMVAWYRAHGYGFLAMTDHNVRLDAHAIVSGAPRPRPPIAGAEESGMVVIPGEEITSEVAGLPVHVNALCTEHAIAGGKYATVTAALAEAVGAVRAQGGVAIVNHPNFEWAMETPDIERALGDDATQAVLLEVWSGHPAVNALGNARHTSSESKWGALLDGGHAVFGVAVDDAHELVPSKEGERAALPGRGWVEVFGADATAESVCSALREGRFYASSGPRLTRLSVEGDAITLAIADARGTVELIGEGGEVLARYELAASAGHPAAARYVLRGGESLVRARITTPAGTAWTQAYRVVAR